MMKRIAISLVCPLIGALLMTSCLDGDDTVLSSDVALLSFEIKDLKTKRTILKDDGTDSTYTTIVSGATVEFVINQTARLVYNTDSLDYGTDVTGVLVDVMASGGVYYLKPDGEAGGVSDSIDFTHPVTFRVTSYDKQFERDYVVSINVHQVDPKKTIWKQVDGANFPILNNQKAFVKGDSLYVIGTGVDGVFLTASAALDDCRDWTTATCIGVEGEGISVLLMDDVFYLKTDAGLYRSKDAISWVTVDEAAEIEDLPGEGMDNGVAWFRHPLKTNEHIIRDIFVSTSEATDTCAQVWTKLSSNNQWVEVVPKGSNIYGCPNLENLTVIHYADKMYAFGGKSMGDRKEPLEALSACYESRDNGRTWKVNQEAFCLPKEFVGREEAFSAATDGEYVWVMWSKSGAEKEYGEVWCGRWNGIK